MKTWTKVLLPATAMTVLAACANNWDTENTKMMKGETAFADALKNNYVMLAEMERKESDWGDAAFFNNKGRATAMGQDVMPQPVAERGLPADKVGELTAAREKLMAALGSGKTSNPEAAAKAQAMFDCWMQEQEENIQPDDIAACKAGFAAAMQALEPQKPMMKKEPMAKPVPRTFVIYFGFDSTAVDGTGMSTVDDIVAYFKEINAASVDISGHTDTMGSSAYNMTLAQQRADAIAAALSGQVKGGVIVNSYGEGRLAVQTGDETKESANRRVEVVVTP